MQSEKRNTHDLEMMESAPFLGSGTQRGGQWHGEAKPRRVGPLALVGAGTLLLVILWASVSAAKGQLPALAASTVSSSYTPGASNATLGFGAILLLSLKERTDRQDAISLIASNSGLTITKTIYAVRGEDISEKARPFGNPKIGDHPISSGYLGSWRTHMDAMKYIVDNHIETALLFEDDVDWDIRIKPNMEALSRGLAASPYHNKNSTPITVDHPYGMDWDIMHLGAAYSRLPKSEPWRSMHHTYEDVDRIEDPGCPGNLWVKDVYCWTPVLELFQVPNTSRIVLPSYDVSGLPAIAVTYEGAQRILYQLSYNELRTTVDWSIAGLLMKGLVKGWTVVPPLFSQFKVGGDHDSDLDGNRFFGAVKSNLNGTTLGIEFSARKELTRTFAPADDEPRTWSVEYWHDLGVEIATTKDQ